MEIVGWILDGFALRKLPYCLLMHRKSFHFTKNEKFSITLVHRILNDWEQLF